MHFLLAIKRSAIACAVALVLGFLGMGALGALLYYAASPFLAPFYRSLNDWQGDWVWSATIWAGMLWSASFLAAGWLELRLQRQGTPAGWRRAAYAAVLWLGAVLAWALVLAVAHE